MAVGGVKGMTDKACREIIKRRLDDTFYIIDLANVLRLYKVSPHHVQLLSRPLWVSASCTSSCDRNHFYTQYNLASAHDC